MMKLLILIFLIGCSGISVISNNENLYSPDFLKRVKSIKSDYRANKKTLALRRLRRLNDEVLNPSEKAYKYNLIGAIYFSKANYEKAIFNFDIALTTSRDDRALNAQINLNLASTYYKLNMIEKSYNSIKSVEPEGLEEKEANKFFHLQYIVAAQLGKERVALQALTRYLGAKKSLSDLRQSPLLERLLSEFSQLSRSEKIRFLEEFEDEKILSAAYLSYLEAEKLYYSGRKDEANDLIDWMSSNFDENPEIAKLIQNFSYRMQSFSKINPRAIGIVLPLSGKGSRYSTRAMRGIDFAFQKLASEDKTAPTIYFRDSKGSGVVGAKAVKELIEKYHVAAVIGGLSTKEAADEYLEAKKHGVLFISLRPIYLPREEKNQLLVEIEGSVESQIASTLKPQVISKFGNKVAIVYPKSNKGQVYVNEFWREASKKGVEVTRVQSYNQNNKDFVLPVKNLLGLKNVRGRKEESELLEEIHSLEPRSTARRTQTLGPNLDFDWVYLPSPPREARLIIPGFKYFDAYRLTFMGPPAWYSQKFVNQRLPYASGTRLFVGDDFDSIDSSFRVGFHASYKRKARTVEILSYDSVKLVMDLINAGNFSSRTDLERYLVEKGTIEGVSGNWRISENVWLKDMSPLKIKGGKVEKLLIETINSEQLSNGSQG